MICISIKYFFHKKTMTGVINFLRFILYFHYLIQIQKVDF